MKKTTGVGVGHLALNQRCVKRREAFGESFFTLGVLATMTAPNAIESGVKTSRTARDGRAQRSVVHVIAYRPS